MSVTRRGMKLPGSFDSFEIKAGILEDATYPARTLKNAETGEEKPDPRAGMHVATIAAALEYGHSQNHPRPFMQNTVAREATKWTDGIVKLVKAGTSLTDAMATIGQVMKEDIQQTINDWPADNSDSWAAFKGFNAGLRFTGEMLNSVEFAVTKKGT